MLCYRFKITSTAMDSVQNKRRKFSLDFQFNHRNQNRLSIIQKHLKPIDWRFDFENEGKNSHPYRNRRKHQRTIGIEEEEETEKTLELELGGAKASVWRVPRRTCERSVAESSKDSSLRRVCRWWSWLRLLISVRDPRRRKPKFRDTKDPPRNTDTWSKLLHL